MKMKVTKAGMLAAMAGIMVFSLTTPASASTGYDGPTPPEVGDPVPAAAQTEIQRISFSGTPASGTYQLEYRDAGGTCTTAALNYNDVFGVVDAALIDGAAGGTWDCTTVFAAGDITVTGGPPAAATPFTLTFGGTFLNTNVFEWAVVNSNLRTSTNSTVYAGVTTVQNGKAATTDTTAPHNGYSSTTNFCVQCHAVHSYENLSPPPAYIGPGDYALLQGNSVTATCQTCHSLFGVAATGRVDSDAITGKPPVAGGMGTASVRTAYDAGAGEYLDPGNPVNGHQLGATATPLPDDVLITQLGWSFRYNALSWYLNREAAGPGTASDTVGGLYCGSCHTPHGEFGQLINSRYYRSDAGADDLNAVQYVFVEGLTGGATDDTWTLTFGPAGSTQTTGPIAWNADAAAVKAALDALGNIDSVTVSGTPLSTTNLVGNYAVAFSGALVDNTPQPQMTGLAENDPTGTVTVVTNQGGSAAAAVASNGTSPTGTVVATRTWADGKPFFLYDATGRPRIYYLNDNAGNWERCDDAGGTTNCVALTTTDSEGQVVYLYGYKLLSASPNHNWLKSESWGMAYRGRDQARWCGTCHTSKASYEFGVEGEYTVGGQQFHSHPTACYYCHGNPADGSSADFPHTSANGTLLKEYPDALCISCHSAGSLP